MRSLQHILLTVTILIVTSCGGDNSDPKPGGETFTVTEYPPGSIGKTETAKVYVHLMPWFETKETNSGKWGQHWTMANKNPDVVLDASTGKRQIAAHYYPMIGPYASGDKDVVEYQLLLMKLAGIDGVLIDWYGTLNLYDYPANKRNADNFIALINKVGLKYAMVYEDQVVNAAVNAGAITDKIAAGKSDVGYMGTQYFSSQDYIQLNGKPLLLTFGPQTFQSAADWTNLFSVLTTKPTFLTLWNESNEAGANAAGEYAWVYQNDQSHLTHLDNFYNKTFAGMKMASAYPGFKDFYKDGGWGDGYFVIDHNGTQTFNTTLDKALESGADYVQLVTWNDYGEGTMIEPTLEFGYSFLTTLQGKLGVTIAQDKLELVTELFEARKKYTTTLKQKKLDQVFYYIVSLQFTEAEELLASLE